MADTQTPALAALERLLAEATPGPWDYVQGKTRLCHVETSCENPHGAGQPVCSIPGKREADAALIVAAVNALPSLLARIRNADAEISRLRSELMAALVADQERGAGMSIILRNWRSRGQSDADWRAVEVAVQFGVGTPEIPVISEYLCEGGVIDHAVHPSGIASARARSALAQRGEG